MPVVESSPVMGGLFWECCPEDQTTVVPTNPHALYRDTAVDIPTCSVRLERPTVGSLAGVGRRWQREFGFFLGVNTFWLVCCLINSGCNSGPSWDS